MLKAVKWGALIVMVMLVFLNKTAHAMFKMHQDKNPVSTKYQSKQQQQMQTPAPFDLPEGSSEQAAKTKKIVTDVKALDEQAKKLDYTDCSWVDTYYSVKALDEQAKKWDYTDCNWVDTYYYFSTFISPIDFIKATHSGYKSIEYLAQALLNSDAFYPKTIPDARFFVYSVLSTRYNDYITNTILIRPPRFFFLQLAEEIIQPYQPVRVTCTPMQYSYFNSLLLSYENEFISNPNISNLKLANCLSDLITIINLRAGVCSPSTQVNSKLDDIYPTVQQILDYYPSEKYVVFAFLVNYPLERVHIDMFIGVQFMQPEKNLQQEISKVFIQLWQEEPNDNLAQLAINVLDFNPLKNDSAAISHSSVFTDAKWEKLNHQLVRDAFTNSYDKFINILNSKKFSYLLLAHGIINPTNYSSIVAPDTTQQSRNFIILHSLNSQKGTDFVQAFKKLLRIMGKNGSKDQKKLAEEIYSELQQ